MQVTKYKEFSSPYVKVKHIEKKFNVFAIILDDEYAEIFADEYKSVVTFIDTLKFNIRGMLITGYNYSCYISQLPKIYINRYIEYCNSFHQNTQKSVNTYDIRPKQFTPRIVFGSTESTQYFEIKEHCAEPDIVIRKINEKYMKIQTKILLGNQIEIINAITEFFHEACSPAWRNHYRFASSKECDEFNRIRSEVTRLSFIYCY